MYVQKNVPLGTTDERALVSQYSCGVILKEVCPSQSVFYMRIGVTMRTH